MDVLSLGVPLETKSGEKRVSVVPAVVPKLKGLGFSVRVEAGAGVAAGFSDAAYVEAGAELVDSVWDSDVVVKVNPPSLNEASRLKSKALLVSLLFAAQNEEVLAGLLERQVSALALEKIPRITRAQKMDVLSSMANIAGYRAVMEAAATYQGFFGAQTTAAGSERPATVLIIGVGVAGLAAIAAAKALGAEVRAFDVRAAAREQVESLGGKFLTVELDESGDGGGGYAKQMSKEFIDAEMALFRKQAKECDIVITTALIPGARAPMLVPEDVAVCLKPGSVIIDMAAEQGGNCALTVAGETREWNGIKIVGVTDFPSRMASQSSRFFARNIVALLEEMRNAEKGGKPFIDLDNDVVRPALIVHGGEKLPPPAAPIVTSPTEAKKPAAEVKAAPKTEPKYPWLPTALGLVVGLAVFGLVGAVAPAAFVARFTVFVLAIFVGWQVVWAVHPSLHTPLMSETNALSGIVVVGGILQVAAGGNDLAMWLGVAALFIAVINVAGGFFVTERMLSMFKKAGSK